MGDCLDQEQRSENMRRIRSANTKPEVLVRKTLTKMGYRYRLHRKTLPGKPDIVFPGRKKSSLFTDAFGTCMVSVLSWPGVHVVVLP
jgi:DNA mismatch endonuclease Vsr